MANLSSQDPLLNLMKMEKELFMRDKVHLPTKERERQWAARTFSLTSALGSAPTGNPGHPGNPGAPDSKYREHDQRAATLPAAAAGMARCHSDNPATPGLSQQQPNSPMPNATLKKRSISSQNGPSPFTGEGGVISPIPIINRRADNDALREYQSNTDDPFNSYKARRLSRPEKILECAVFEDPSIFIKQNAMAQSRLSPTLSYPSHPRRTSHRLSISPRQPPMLDQFSTLSQSPATPTTDNLSEFTPPTSVGLSRQSSSICGGVTMMKINSHMSNAAPEQILSANNSPLDPNQSFFTNGNHDLKLSTTDTPLLDCQTGGVPDHSWLAQYPDLPVIPALPVHSSPFVEDTSMKRSSSTETNNSATSQASCRSQEASSSGVRKLAPKLPTTSPAMSQQSSSSGHEVIRTRSADGSVKEVVSIAKAPYVRPHHDKIKCTQCNVKPDGFRGEHELRRHTERAHAIVLRKAFVCVDISPNKKFLRECKACNSKKRYNAYYNTAAHLRRVHFNPKKKGSKGKIKPEESRGGKGGGDWPPMDIVKEWMTEIEEIVTPDMAPYDDEEPEDDNLPMLPHSFRANAGTQPLLGNTSHIPTPSIGIPNGNCAPTTMPPLSLSAPVPLQLPAYDNMSLHLSQPSDTQASASSGFLDLSLDVSTNDSGEQFALWDMSPADDPQLMDFKNPFSFSDCS